MPDIISLLVAWPLAALDCSGFKEPYFNTNLFQEEKGVVAEGFLDGKNFFRASKILAKHDENYMPPEVKEALEATNWYLIL